jgi:hypothetical protein
VFLSGSVLPNINGFAPPVPTSSSSTGNANQPPGSFINESFVVPSNIAGHGFSLAGGAPNLTLITRFLVGEQGMEVVPPDPRGYPIRISDLSANATFTVSVQYTYEPSFAGTPGKANCHGQSVSALARQYGGLNNAATTLEYSSVSTLQEAVTAYCES